jgi:tRNA G18 (ribose-2'-O)-methylase SpoU
MIRYLGLRDRDLRSQGLFVAEGRLLVARALESSCGVEAIFAARACAAEAEALAARSAPSGAPAIPVTALGDDELSSVAGFDFHRGMLAVVRRPALSPAREDFAQGLFPPDESARDKTPFSDSGILVLPSITDPGNLGTLLRSALAFGFDTVWLGGECCDPFNRKALRASMGAALSLRLRVAVPEDLRSLAARGIASYAAEIREGAIVAGDGRAAFPCALTLGNEHDGIPEPWRLGCGESIMVAVSGGVDSLNVAIAGSLLMWELSRRGPH